MPRRFSILWGRQFCLQPPFQAAPEDVDDKVAPLVKEADPEFERLLAEEEEIERSTRDHHETPHFRMDD